MIKLCGNIFMCDDKGSVELLKIACHNNAYPEDMLVWEQGEFRAVIGMLDADMIIYDNGADYEELSEFINMISPRWVFSAASTLEKLGLCGYKKAFAYRKDAKSLCERESDSLSSKEIYELLNVPELELPEYPQFAVDICHRLNNGTAQYFAIKDKCAAVTLNTNNSCIMNGIASHQKGMGSLALAGVLSLNKDKTAFCVCREDVRGFYEKNGFEYMYDVGYWRKSS